MGLEIRILGPCEVRAGATPLPLSGQRRVGVLVRLALDAGRVVSAEQLLADVWGQSSASTAGKQLHIVVSKLRELLAPHQDGEIIATVAGGYRLELAREQIDAHLFSRLVRQARSARDGGDRASADTLFRQALALWRAPALAEVSGTWARVEAGRMQEEHLAALEEHVELRLSTGDHHGVIADLATHIQAHPLRERPRAQLMLALHRAERPSEALAVYQEARRVLVDELGVEPGAALRRLQRAVLAKDPALDLPSSARRAPLSGPFTPAELPADTRAFTARDAELAWLDKVLTDTSLTAPAVACVDGPGGIGKSALAIRAAHAAADRFADGVLYVNLHGSTVGLPPLSPSEALGRLLRSLGLDGKAVPADLEEAAARYRSLSANRALLIVLDNARDVRQIRPLIPANPDCAVIVTSRNAVVTLADAQHLHLAGLEHSAATELLALVAGAERILAEPQAVARIVGRCGGFPLAVRIVAARLAARPDWRLSDLADRLDDAAQRLDVLQYEDLTVRAVIAVSHRYLSEEDAGRDASRVFTLLGLLDTPTYTPAATAALADWPEPRAEAALERLLDARLLEGMATGHYRMHDLIRLYAREQATRDLPEAERRTATRRGLHHYLATARTASLHLNPTSAILGKLSPDQPGLSLPTPHEAIAWIDLERDNLIAAARQAATRTDDPGTAIGLAACVQWPFSNRGWLAELIEIHQLTLRVAAQAEDWTGQAQEHNFMGTVYKNQGRFEEAIDHLEQAIRCWDRTAQPQLKAGTLYNLGTTYARVKRFDDALATLDQALATAEESGPPAYEASILNGRAGTLTRMGRVDDAIVAARRSLEIWTAFDNPHGEGAANDTMADAYRQAGRLPEAETHFRRAVELQHQAGHRAVEAISLWGLGDTLYDLGRHDEARECWRQSAATLVDVHLLTEEEMGELLAQDKPQPPPAVTHF